MSTALAIFVKTPGYSSVKTRLAASAGKDLAEQFHRLAAAAVAAVARAATPAVTPCWAVAEREALDDALWTSLPTFWQGEGDLGSRLNHVCSHLQIRHGSVLMIGADAPQITVALLRAAVEAIDDESTPFVIGRAQDGGFWLFGTRQQVSKNVWLNPRYSTADTADQLIHVLSPAGQIAWLPTLNDVDEAGDLTSLVGALAALDHPLPEQETLLEWLLSESLGSGE